MLKSSLFEPTYIKRVIFFILFDVILSFLTLFLSYELRFNFQVSAMDARVFYEIFTLLVTVKLFVFIFFKIYQFSWRYFSITELKQLVYAHITTYLIFSVLYLSIGSYIFEHFARSIIVIDFFLSLVFIGTLRVLKRVVLESQRSTSLKNTMVIGVSKMAQTIISNKKEYNAVSMVEDAQSSIGTYFSGLKVKSLDDLDDIIKEDKITEVIITKEYPQARLNLLHSKFASHNIYDIKIISLNSSSQNLKQLTVEDLLARHPKDLDKKVTASFIKNSVVMITGAGGSIGSEIVRQVLSFGAKKLILIDHSEFNLYEIDQEVDSDIVVPILQSVRELDDLDRTYLRYKPDIVIHAAAYKHVPLVELNVDEAIKNNIIGTKNVIDLAIKYEVKKVVLISTDKAVRPTNVMGTTKRICELYASNVDSKQTEIVAVRFGNVLGSSGSVIPKFRSQIEKGESLTVTHKDITRYFMLISEACELVLQAGAIGGGGEIFILDMGEPIKILDLAKKMIELSGKSDVKIEFTGLRAGEKLYEELLLDDSDCSTDYDSITVAKSTPYNIKKLNQDIQNLLITDNKLDQLKKIVPEFNHNLNH